MKNVCGVWIEKLICELALFFGEFYMFCAFLFLNQFFSLFTPSPDDPNAEFYAKRPCAFYVAVAAELVGERINAM